MKVVINKRYGVFSVSREAVLLARRLSKNPKWGGACIIGDKYEVSGTTVDTDNPVCKDYGFIHSVPRDDPILVRVVEELGEKANNRWVDLVVVEIPDNVEWIIEKDDDGRECVAEKHRTWSG